MLKSKQQLQGYTLFDAVSLKGYGTKYDPTSMQLFSPTGQNVVIENGVISPRFGSQIIGADNNQPYPIKSQWTFNKRGIDDKPIMLRAYNTVLEYYHPTLNVWTLLQGGFTAGQRFGHDTQNNATDNVGYVFFCNGHESVYRWSGSNTKVLTADDTGHILTIDDALSPAQLLFTATGSLIINGILVTYTGLSGQTFTGCSSLAGINAGDPIAQTPLAVAAAPKGNILLVDNMALYIAGVIGNENILYRSKIDDATNYTIPSPRISGSPFIIGITEGGTAITALMKDEKVIYIAKGSLIKTLEYSQTSNADTNDIPIQKPLKTYDGKSELSGVVNQNAVSSNGNGIFFVNNRKEVCSLDRLENIDYPQISPISDIIKPTILTAIFDEAATIVFNQKLYLACKQSSGSLANDTVFVYDIIEKRWEVPIVGWYVNDWNVINDILNWGSSIINNSYIGIVDKADNSSAFTAVWRSWQETFANPHLQKTCMGVYVEGYVSDLMTKDNPLVISLLYDENGATSIMTAQVYTSNFGIIFTSTPYNPFGVNPFGFERFGSNKPIGGFKKFRCFIPLKDDIEFYTLQIQFSSDGIYSDWQVVRWGFLLGELMPENSKIQLAIS